MRIGCLQFAPQVGDIDNNLNRADAVLSKANPDDLDILVLPELAFTGYNFKSLQAISPFLEPSGSGISSLWARTMALKYNCVVVVGYPEKVDVSPSWPTGPEYYNSAIAVNGEGETIANYRKSFLYFTDETWALEGNRGFYDGYIPGLGITSIGICMDINPYKFEAPWHAFEFAFHVLEVESNLVIVSMAWMTREERRNFTRMPNEPDMDTLTYWVTRLEPLIRAENKEEIIVVFCNRTGIEDEATYTGTSAVVGIQDGEVNVYGILGRGEKELLVVDTAHSPYAKLVYRPDPDSTTTSRGNLETLDHFDKKPSAEIETRSDSKPSLPNSETSKMEDREAQAFSAGVVERNIPNEATSEHIADSSLQNTPNRSSTPQATQALSRSQASSTTPILPISELQPVEQRRTDKVKPRVSSISIPPPPSYLGHGDSSQSPGVDGFNVPTPSAPSPTPMAVRPRLIIPQSPTLFSNQSLPEQDPISAASSKSMQSIKSNESEASIQTIRSNPRPPEDSTPYPHSGVPLSGYPSNFSRSGFGGKIYGGYVTISQGMSDELSPRTPFENTTPASPGWFWEPPDRPLHAGGWTTGTQLGRRPEPFPWPDVKPVTRSSSTKGQNDEVKPSAIEQELNQHNSQYPPSNASSNITQKSKPSVGTPKPSPEKEEHPARPSSPKSRNASRSGVKGRSDSSLSQRHVSTTVSQNFENTPQRAASRNRTQPEPTTATPVGDRSNTPKLHHLHHAEASESIQKDPNVIHIAASPSLWQGASRASVATPVAIEYYRRPMSRIDHLQNKTSPQSNKVPLNLSGKDEGKQHEKNERQRWSTASPVGHGNRRNSERSVSRGRQPRPKTALVNVDAVDPNTERATSADSTRNVILHTRVRKLDFNESKSPDLPNGRGSQSERRPSRTTQERSIFERVEVVSCPSCPVHGQQAAGSAGSPENPSFVGTEELLPASENFGSEIPQNAGMGTTEASTQPRTELPVPKEEALSGNKTTLINERATSQLNERDGDVSFGEMVVSGTIAAEIGNRSNRAGIQSDATERKTSRPTFNVSTPVAMTFCASDIVSTSPLPSCAYGNENTSSGRCADDSKLEGADSRVTRSMA